MHPDIWADRRIISNGHDLTSIKTLQRNGIRGSVEFGVVDVRESASIASGFVSLQGAQVTARSRRKGNGKAILRWSTAGA